MPITVNLRKGIHRKTTEYCTPLPLNTTAGGFVCQDDSGLLLDRQVVYVASATVIYTYYPEVDSWALLPTSGITGTFGAGACGEMIPASAMGGVVVQTATAGTTTSLTTSRTIVKNLAGTKIQVIDGTGGGYEGTIVSNTTGANSVITVTPASGVAFSATSTFKIFAGSLWFMNSGAGTVGFSVYDFATNVWTARSVTNLPTTWGTDGQLISTRSRSSNGGAGFVNSTATAGASTTLTDTTRTWLVNGWANAQVRIISGTGIGQVRSIASNTATVLTVSAAWTVNPDATSVYRIEGNDDYMYLVGSNAVTMYRYNISTNTWAALSPTAARAGAMATGGMADWVCEVKNASWNDGTYAPLYGTSIYKQNGRYIYSFRGGASNVMDAYDISLNTWVSGIPYGQQSETFTTGSSSVAVGDTIYLQKEATSRIFAFDIPTMQIKPWMWNPNPQGTAVVGDKMFHVSYTDGATLDYIYTLHHTRAELNRWLVI